VLIADDGDSTAWWPWSPLRTASASVLADNWPMMQRWLAFLRTKVQADGRDFVLEAGPGEHRIER
jgi:hypothetical protein